MYPNIPTADWNGDTDIEEPRQFCVIPYQTCSKASSMESPPVNGNEVFRKTVTISEDMQHHYSEGFGYRHEFWKIKICRSCTVYSKCRVLLNILYVCWVVKICQERESCEK